MQSHDTLVTAFKAPLYVAWEITHKCNARCVHCYSNSGPGRALASELSTSDALGLIDQLADAGLLVLAFSGGEPMLRTDWSTLARRAVQRGLSVNIGTNGSSVTPKTADLLAELEVKSVTVSLDSHRAAVHDQFRQLPGLYQKATRAIRLLADRGVRVVVGFTPTRRNWNDGRQVIELARSLGAEAVNLSEYVPAGRGGRDLALAPSDLRTVLEDWVRWRDELMGRITLIWHDCRVGMLVPEHERRAYMGCGAGRLLARILPDGSITPCVFLPTTIGKYPEQSFAEIWGQAGLLAQFRERSGIKGNCGECEHLHTCGGCRAVAYAYSEGDPLAGDPHCWVKSDVAGPLLRLADGEGPAV
jgi:radical SAM protein with 4Fe4S-binding SPASM domain